MLRTIFVIGLLALAGLFFLKLAFGLFAVGFGLLGWLFFFAIKVAIVGALIYLVIRIVSPDTARRLREKWSGPNY
jgi:membrane protein implicated in regulation of membrane protease activity